MTILNGEQIKRVIQTNEHLFRITVLKNDDLAIGQGETNFYLVIRDSNSGSVKKTLNGHTDNVHQLMELENKNLISCSLDNSVRIWNLTLSSSLIRTITYASGVASFAILQNGNLASGLWNGTIEIRNFETGQLIRTLNGHTLGICRINCLHVLSNGNLLSASFDKTIKVWDAYNGTQIFSSNNHSTQINQLEFLQSGNLVSASGIEIMEFDLI